MSGFDIKNNKNEILNILKQSINDFSNSLWVIELKQKYWGLEIMPEAVIKVLKYGFNSMFSFYKLYSFKNCN